MKIVVMGSDYSLPSSEAIIAMAKMKADSSRPAPLEPRTPCRTIAYKQYNRAVKAQEQQVSSKAEIKKNNKAPRIIEK